MTLNNRTDESDNNGADIMIKGNGGSNKEIKGLKGMTDLIQDIKGLKGMRGIKTWVI